jgi:hypothetical protein
MLGLVRCLWEFTRSHLRFLEITWEVIVRFTPDSSEEIRLRGFEVIGIH